MSSLALRRVAEDLPSLESFQELHDKAPTLRSLVIHGCRLTSIRGIPALPSLVELNLSSNTLVDLEPASSWASLGSLRKLDLSSNRLRGAPFVFTAPSKLGLPALTQLLLPYNAISSFAGLAGSSIFWSLNICISRPCLILSAPLFVQSPAPNWRSWMSAGTIEWNPSPLSAT